MTLAFTNGAYCRASGTLNAFGGLSDALVREGHPPMVSRSGDREYADQLRIWNERMVLYPDVNGRKVYGKKLWQGKTWYRIHPDVVAVPQDPPVSNHGKRRSNDLTYPYNNRNTAAHKRARQLAPAYGITWEGVNFNEDWHWTYWGPLGTIGNSGGAPAGNEDEMSAEAERQIAEIHAMLTPGAAGGKQQGAVHKTLSAIASTVSDGKAAAVKAQVASESLVADFQAGQAGVRNAGRLLSLLSRVEAQAKAANAALSALATAKGVDPEAILRAVENGVKEAMRDITFTTDVDG